MDRFRSLLVLVSLSVFGLVSCTSDSALGTVAGPAITSSQWVVSWGAPPENGLPSASNPGGNEQTYRFIILPTIDGTQERLHFSNQYGSVPITIGAARLGVLLDGVSVNPATDTAITFDGNTSVTIAAGQQVTSDILNLNYAFGQKLAVTVYVKGTFPPLTQHDSQVTTNYTSGPGSGDRTSDIAGTSFTIPLTEWFLLTGVDVFGPYQGTIALFGSSSIDGHGANYDNNNAYPVPNVVVPAQDNDRPSDWLARSLFLAGYRIGVLNAGTIGDPAGRDSRTLSGQSTAGIDRIGRDVLQQAGIKTVLIYLGGIDLRLDCVSASNVEASLSNMVAQANTAGVRVILATIPPAEYCTTSPPSLLPSAANPWQGDIYPGPENPGSTQRNLVNQWIKTTGASLPGVVAVADFDAALAYPSHPDFMQPNFTSSDNFHPNGAGYQAQNNAISLQSILGQ